MRLADFLGTPAYVPFAYGMLVGLGFGGVLGAIGWYLGYDYAMRSVGEWIKPRNRDRECFGDMPTLPPQRDRRHFPTTPGRSV